MHIVSPLDILFTYTFICVYTYVYIIRDTVRKRELFPILIYSLNAYNSWIWASLKQGARDSIQVSHMSGREPSTAASRTYNIRKLDWKWRQDLIPAMWIYQTGGA